MNRTFLPPQPFREKKLDWEPETTPSPNEVNSMSMNTVGKLRQQSALCDAKRRVVLVSTDPVISSLLSTLEVTDLFPDTTNEKGSFDEPTFKIRVGFRPSPNGK